MKRILFVGTPCYGGQINHITARCIARLEIECLRTGVGFIPGDVDGISLVSRARDEVAHAFLKTDATAILWVDGDVLFKPEWALEMLAKDVPIIGGTYPKKELLFDRAPHYIGRGVFGQELEASITEQAFVALDADKKNGIRPPIVFEGPERDMCEFKYLPTGFLMVQRGVFRKMIEAHPELLTRSPAKEPVYALHLPVIDPVTRQQLSEDYSFLYRARKLGYRVLCYRHAECAHVGTYVYRGQNFEPDSVADEIDEIVAERDSAAQ